MVRYFRNKKEAQLWLYRASPSEFDSIFSSRAPSFGTALQALNYAVKKGKIKIDPKYKRRFKDKTLKDYTRWGIIK